MEIYDEINVVLKGKSLQKHRIKNIKGPTFLVSIVNPNERDNIKKILNKENINLKEDYIFIYSIY